MNIAIIGYGRMGKEIRRLASDRSHVISSIIDPVADGATHGEITKESLNGADVAIEFTGPDFAVANIEKTAKLGVNMVVGTTGWGESLSTVEKIIESTGTGLIHAPNFSVGVSVFYEIVKRASWIFDKLDDYDVFCHEWHHKGKVDSPSGTAKKIAETVLSVMKRKSGVVFERLDRKRADSELHVSSTRGGWVPGTHEVVFDGEFDSVELVHRARNRGGLASGVLHVAEWIKGKKGFFEFSDYLKDFLGI